MSLTGTASGWLFAAYRPRESVLALLAQEQTKVDAAFEARLDEVRENRMARAVDLSVPGVSALAAPVFDGAGHDGAAASPASARRLLSTRDGTARLRGRCGASRTSCRAGLAGSLSDAPPEPRRYSTCRRTRAPAR